MESVSLGPGTQCSPISGKSHSPWCPGSHLQSLPFDVEGQVDSGRMESDSESQASQVLIPWISFVFHSCFLILFVGLFYWCRVTMRTTNLSPPFKGPSHWTVVEVEIQELEKRLRWQKGKRRLTTRSNWKTSAMCKKPYRRNLWAWTRVERELLNIPHPQCPHCLPLGQRSQPCPLVMICLESWGVLYPQLPCQLPLGRTSWPCPLVMMHWESQAVLQPNRCC